MVMEKKKKKMGKIQVAAPRPAAKYTTPPPFDPLEKGDSRTATATKASLGNKRKAIDAPTIASVSGTLQTDGANKKTKIHTVLDVPLDMRTSSKTRGGRNKDEKKTTTTPHASTETGRPVSGVNSEAGGSGSHGSDSGSPRKHSLASPSAMRASIPRRSSSRTTGVNCPSQLGMDLGVPDVFLCEPVLKDFNERKSKTGRSWRPSIYAGNSTSGEYVTELCFITRMAELALSSAYNVDGSSETKARTLMNAMQEHENLKRRRQFRKDIETYEAMQMSKAKTSSLELYQRCRKPHAQHVIHGKSGKGGKLHALSSKFITSLTSVSQATIGQATPEAFDNVTVTNLIDVLVKKALPVVSAVVLVRGLYCVDMTKGRSASKKWTVDLCTRITSELDIRLRESYVPPTSPTTPTTTNFRWRYLVRLLEYCLSENLLCQHELRTHASTWLNLGRLQGLDARQHRRVIPAFLDLIESIMSAIVRDMILLRETLVFGMYSLKDAARSRGCNDVQPPKTHALDALRSLQAKNGNAAIDHAVGADQDMSRLISILQNVVPHSPDGIGNLPALHLGDGTRGAMDFDLISKAEGRNAAAPGIWDADVLLFNAACHLSSSDELPITALFDAFCGVFDCNTSLASARDTATRLLRVHSLCLFAPVPSNRAVLARLIRWTEKNEGYELEKWRRFSYAVSLLIRYVGAPLCVAEGSDADAASTTTPAASLLDTALQAYNKDTSVLASAVRRVIRGDDECAPETASVITARLKEVEDATSVHGSVVRKKLYAVLGIHDTTLASDESTDWWKMDVLSVDVCAGTLNAARVEDTDPLLIPCVANTAFILDRPSHEALSSSPLRLLDVFSICETLWHRDVHEMILLLLESLRRCCLCGDGKLSECLRDPGQVSVASESSRGESSVILGGSSSVRLSLLLVASALSCLRREVCSSAAASALMRVVSEAFYGTQNHAKHSRTTAFIVVELGRLVKSFLRVGGELGANPSTLMGILMKRRSEVTEEDDLPLDGNYELLIDVLIEERLEWDGMSESDVEISRDEYVDAFCTEETMAVISTFTSSHLAAWLVGSDSNTQARDTLSAVEDILNANMKLLTKGTAEIATAVLEAMSRSTSSGLMISLSDGAIKLCKLMTRASCNVRSAHVPVSETEANHRNAEIDLALSVFAMMELMRAFAAVMKPIYEGKGSQGFSADMAMTCLLRLCSMIFAKIFHDTQCEEDEARDMQHPLFVVTLTVAALMLLSSCSLLSPESETRSPSHERVEAMVVHLAVFDLVDLQLLPRLARACGTAPHVYVSLYARGPDDSQTAATPPIEPFILRLYSANKAHVHVKDVVRFVYALALDEQRGRHDSKNRRASNSGALIASLLRDSAIRALLLRDRKALIHAMIQCEEEDAALRETDSDSRDDRDFASIGLVLFSHILPLESIGSQNILQKCIDSSLLRSGGVYDQNSSPSAECRQKVVAESSVGCRLEAFKEIVSRLHLERGAEQMLTWLHYELLVIEISLRESLSVSEAWRKAYERESEEDNVSASSKVSRLLALVSIACVIANPLDSTTDKLANYIRYGGALPAFVNAFTKQLGFILSLLQKMGQAAGYRDSCMTCERLQQICILMEEDFLNMVGSFFSLPRFTYGDSSADSVVVILKQLSKLSACCVGKCSDLDSIDTYAHIVMEGLSAQALPFIQNQQGGYLAAACGLSNDDNEELSIDRRSVNHKTFYVHVWFYTSLLMPLVVWIRRRSPNKVAGAQDKKVKVKGTERLALLCTSIFALLCDERSHILSSHVCYEDGHLFTAGPISHVELSSLTMHGKLLAILYGILAPWEPAWLTATAAWSKGLRSTASASNKSPLTDSMRDALLDAFMSHVDDQDFLRCCSELRHRIQYFLMAMGRVSDGEEKTMKFDVNVVEYRSDANTTGGSASAHVHDHSKNITSRVEVHPWNLVWTCEQSTPSRQESDGAQVPVRMMPYDDDEAAVTAAPVSVSGPDSCTPPFWLQGTKQLPSSLAVWELENGTAIMQ